MPVIVSLTHLSLYQLQNKTRDASYFVSWWLAFPYKDNVQYIAGNVGRERSHSYASVRKPALSSKVKEWSSCSRVTIVKRGQESAPRLGGRSREKKAPVQTCTLACTGAHTSEQPGLASIRVAAKACIPYPPNLPPHQCATCLPAPFSFEHIF